MASNIESLAPASVPAPAAGDITYFFDTTNQNRLSYKDSTNTVYLYKGDGVIIQEKLIEAMDKAVADLTCALKKGVITSTEFNTILTAMLTFTSGDGTTTYTVEAK